MVTLVQTAVKAVIVPAVLGQEEEEERRGGREEEREWEEVASISS